MIYRDATVLDIPSIAAIQQRYHVSTISDADRSHGFVTTLFTEEQFRALIETEQGISICCDGDQVVAYAMAASWHYWSKWPLFQHMIKDLPDTTYLGQVLSLENSYQYGPVCIEMAYRGKDVLPKLFDFSRRNMQKRFPILITFINLINKRSIAAHVDKLGLDIIKTFEFNSNTYYELGYDTTKSCLKEPVLDYGPFYHGTKVDLQVGDLLQPGFRSNYGELKQANFIYMTATLDAAIWGAELAVGESKERIYIVEPTGDFENDPNLTDKKFPGNPTRSYRTRDPLRIIGEVTEWTGHTPEVLQNMLDHIKKLKEQGIEAIND